ncbi:MULTISPECIES: DeoR/GlpR family DNA-binding transcription regulator [Anaerococcus]|uniref:DeoR/GlpR family DNA-binding transcription regulator n=1 Tax=Anaerococcus TaxID=165779 RepID=UPI0027BA591A|nr:MULTISPECIES: DeoR/GlpR family DNA-binding transcription regulator [Anaerococcus]MDU2557819.1 DeoR/GlpR family DNA-binding transcription regulator [Anaerococcus prevotii]MDU2585343.1 DeoR/GlpR family DNA-binding transcription regulator [Anaerococcus prevotii]MDU3137175.1 DeoR/GlpR family DNA-binding transcription regulator [Anaerococcus prevotii]
MFQEERLSFIIETLDEKERVSVGELAQKLDVSEVTIRKDLKELEEKKVIKRTHGGAIRIKKNVEELTTDSKKHMKTIEKENIAKLASGLLDNSMTIFLDAGTTTSKLAKYLKEFKDLTVISYDLELALALSKYPKIKTYILGGYIENKTRTVLSLDGYENLSRFHADICFMGTDAYDDNFVYSTSETKGRIKSKMIENSRVSVMMTDTSKYPSKGLYSFGKIGNFDYFITEETKKL